VLGGLALGFFLYVYMGARLLVLFMPVYFAALWVVDRKTARANLGNGLAFAGALGVVMAPIAAWALAHPDEFMSRANQMGVFQSGWMTNEVQLTGRNQFVILADLLRQAFLTINFFPATVHYGSPYPMLDWVSAAAFLIGIVYSLVHVFDRRHLLLQGWFWSGMLVGGALVIVPSDNAYRIAIVFPAVCLFVALGVDRLLALAGGSLPALLRWRDFVPAALFLVPVAALNLKAYFVDFGAQCRYSDTATRFASFMGEKLAEVGPDYNAYLLGNDSVWYSIHKSVDYLSGEKRLVNVTLPDLAFNPPHYLDLEGNPVVFDPTRKNIFFFIPERSNEITSLQALLPGGTIGQRPDCGRPLLGYYLVDPTTSR
jgi:hypothetical protein